MTAPRPDRRSRLNELVRNGWACILGVHYEEVEPHGLVASIDVADHMVAPSGFIHGGVLTSFADTVCGVATIETLHWQKSTFATTRLETTFHHASQARHLFCACELVQRIHGEMVWEATIFEPDGSRVASFSCTQRVRPFGDEEVLEFMALDVFGDRFAGNPLAVVFGADELEEEEMFRITREFNYSETVFISSSESERYPVRIFTPRLEVPFAGHPTIGAAVAIAISTGSRQPILVEKIGDVRVDTALVAPGIGSASFEVPRVAEPGPAFDLAPARVMETIGLDENDLDEHRQITYYDGGIRFVLIPLRTEEAVSRARLDLGSWREVFEHAWSSQLYLVANRQERNEFRVRLFAPGAGVSEDPATGSAAAVLGRFIADERGEGRHELVIRQGDELGRPSRIGVVAEKGQDEALRVVVSGSAALTMKGKLIRSGSGTGALVENRS